MLNDDNRRSRHAFRSQLGIAETCKGFTGRPHFLSKAPAWQARNMLLAKRASREEAEHEEHEGSEGQEDGGFKRVGKARS